jgi:hypothetical protein
MDANQDQSRLIKLKNKTVLAGNERGAVKPQPKGIEPRISRIARMGN